MEARKIKWPSSLMVNDLILWESNEDNAVRMMVVKDFRAKDGYPGIVLRTADNEGIYDAISGYPDADKISFRLKDVENADKFLLIVTKGSNIDPFVSGD